MFTSKVLRLFFLFSFAGLAASAQQQSYPLPPRPDPQIEIDRQWREVRRHLNDLDTLKNFPARVGKTSPIAAPEVLLLEYRRSTVEELQLLAPEKEDSLKYADFLKQKNTGILKMVMDLGCDEFSPKDPNAQICSRFSMPGGGSAFSFRQKDYQIWKLADLLYNGKDLMAFGQMSLGFMVDLGGVPLNLVTKNTKGLDYIYTFSPATDLPDADLQNKQFVDGYKLDGFDYRKLLPVKEGNTYVLRSIAYDGIVPRNDRGLHYNELDYDKRMDVIVAFHILRRDFNGTLTVVWKILQSKKSTILK